MRERNISVTIRKMARERHLNKAPIVEAAINIRVKNPASIKADAFLPLKAQLPNYPDVKTTRAVEFGGKFGKQKVEQIFEDKGIQAYVFKSEDGKNVAQFGVAEFTFSRLKPYTEWELVLAEAKRLWNLYTQKATPEMVTRIGVRYINKLDLKLPIEDFKEYLKAPPEVPKRLPQGVSQFLTRVVIQDKEMVANIVQAMGGIQKPDSIEILLDIDVFKIKMTEVDKFETIWPEFEELRKFKNRIFFNSITEKTARLFE